MLYVSYISLKLGGKKSTHHKEGSNNAERKGRKKKKCGYIQWVTIHPLKNKEILSCATIQTNLESILLSEINQSQKNTYCMLLLILNGQKSNFIDKENINRLVVTECWKE